MTLVIYYKYILPLPLILGASTRNKMTLECAKIVGFLQLLSK